MKEYEFTGIDVLREMHKIMQQMKNEKRLFINEDIAKDKEFVQSFLDAAMGYSIIESQLKVNNYYVPMTFSIDYVRKNMGLTLVTKAARYIGKEGSRLVFMYDTTKTPILFPQDDALPEDGYRFIFSNMDELDKIIVLFSLKFTGDDWSTAAYGYSEDDGKPQPLANI